MSTMIISSKNLVKMAKKWHKLAGIRKNRASQGYFVVYTAEQRRILIPLACLESEIFRELLKLSEDEFGEPCEGPITLPCDAFFVEYVMSLISNESDDEAHGDVEKALLLSVVTSRCSSPAVSLNQQIAGCS